MLNYKKIFLFRINLFDIKYFWHYVFKFRSIHILLSIVIFGFFKSLIYYLIHRLFLEKKNLN